MAFFSKNSNDLMSDINVTPFVDVMLVLLIIFMVTAPMMIQGEDVQLPEAKASNIKGESIDWVISVTRNGAIYFNDQLVDLGYFDNYLSDKLKKYNGTPKVFLKGDKNVEYGIVVNVMSKIRSAGIKNIAMLTIPEKSGSGE